MLTFFQLHGRITRFDKNRWKRTALIDWSFVLCLGAILTVLEFTEPFKREFSLEDKSIQFTHALHERVPPWGLIVIAGLCPLLCLALANVISVRCLWDFHSSWLGCTLSFLITGIITNIIKLTTGRPRPDFIDRCRPLPGSVDNPFSGLTNASICTQTSKAIFYDGFKSFPSGHSSLAFSGLGFLAFYLAGKLHVFHERGWLLKVAIFFCPFIGAALVAITRTMDNRHHWHDVLAGSTLGLLAAWVCYRHIFHPLASARCHEALPPRDAFNQVQMQDYGDEYGVEEGSDSERIQLQASRSRADQYADV